VNAPADVAIIGGGIVGCAAAAFLAEAGVHVEVYEREEVAAGASGRNSGSIQHPFDPVLAELHRETLDHYRGMDGVGMPSAPAGRRTPADSTPRARPRATHGHAVSASWKRAPAACARRANARVAAIGRTG